MDYGKVGLLRFLLPWTRDNLVGWFEDQYERVVAAHQLEPAKGSPEARPSIVAHSFGTYLCGYAMLKYPEIRFDKMILCGCILPRDFDWSTLFARGQVYEVLHEYAVRDPWGNMANAVTVGAGDSGGRGFLYAGPQLQQVRCDHLTHSDYFTQLHMAESWIEFLSRKTPTYGIKHGSSISDENEFRSIAERTEEIDHKVYGGIPEFAANEASMDQAVEWVRVEPDIYTFLYNRRGQQWTGYVNAIPVTDQAFRTALQRGLKDCELTGDHIVKLIPDSIVRLFALSIAVDPTAKEASLGLLNREVHALLDGFFQKWKRYAKEVRIRIKDVVAVGWTPQGRRICNDILGMSKSGSDEFGHPIYYLAIEPALMRKARFEPLRSLAKVYADEGLFRVEDPEDEAAVPVTEPENVE